MIKFLKDSKAMWQRQVYCGDGCCSWQENDGFDFFKEGDEVQEWNINLYTSNLEEGVDYVITDD